MTMYELYWLAGLVEGEGCFSWYERLNTPHPKTGRRYTVRIARLDIGMTDEDVVWRAHRLLRCTQRLRTSKPTPGRKPAYYLSLSGAQAIGWMMTLYPLMGARRQARIRTVIANWKKYPVRYQGIGRFGAKERRQSPFPISLH